MKRAVVLLALGVACAAAAFAQSEWVGAYAFEEDGGKNAGGTVIFIFHENVMETDDGLRATLQSNGYQMSKDLNCTAKVKGNRLEIYFDGYGENNGFETHNSPRPLCLPSVPLC